MDLLNLGLLFFGGLFAGLYASSVGGGGLLTLPLLLFTGVPIHIALGTQRFAALILEVVSSLKFYKEKKIDFKVALPLGIVSGLGALVGVHLIIAIDAKYLNLIIGVLLVLIFLLITFKDKLGVKERNFVRKHHSLLAILTFLFSIWGGFFGPGFGVFITILMVLFGYTFISSAAISRVIGVFMSAAAMIIFAQHGLINYLYGGVLGGGFAIGSWIGIGIALKKGNHYVKGLLTIVILVSALKLILDFLNIKIL